MLTVTKAIRDFVIEKGAQANLNDDEVRTFIAESVNNETISASELLKVTQGETYKMVKGHNMSTTQQVFGGNSTTPAGGGDIRVKAPSEMYKSTRVTGKHFRTGEVVTTERGKPAELPSEWDYARAGVLFKMWAQRSGNFGTAIVFSDHEKAIQQEMFDRDMWAGEIGGAYSDEIPGARVKALLSDSTSGGVALNPVWFDEAVVQFPLLNGELYPFVDIRDVPRGSTVQGASVGNPTVSWGTKSGTEAPIFDTDSLVAQIDCTIHPVTCVVEIGRDLMNDSPVNIGQVLIANIGQRFTSEFDKVIAVGNATTQPEGIFTASGLTAVNSSGGAGAAATVTDYESLIFAVGKQYRSNQYRCTFIANDVSYRRARGIPVNSSTDVRRVFGMDHQSYQILEYPYRINNSIPNARIAYGALSTYRLYRRQGVETEMVTGDMSLARANKIGWIARARMGGKIVDTNAWAKITDAQA